MTIDDAEFAKILHQVCLASVALQSPRDVHEVMKAKSCVDRAYRKLLKARDAASLSTTSDDSKGRTE